MHSPKVELESSNKNKVLFLLPQKVRKKQAQKQPHRIIYRTAPILRHHEQKENTKISNFYSSKLKQHHIPEIKSIYLSTLTKYTVL